MSDGAGGAGGASALAANAVQQAGSGSARALCETCCKSQIAAIDGETNRIAAIADPIQRNAAITKAYTDLAASEPDNRWVKLASIVSAQGGCAMKDVGGYRSWLSWKQPLDDATGMSFTNNMYQALGEANKNIFTSIYPVAAYQARYGVESLKVCYAAEGKRLEPELRNAFEELERGKLDVASDAIAQFEQMKVVQPVYDKYSGTFAAMSAASAIQKPFAGTNLYDIPVSTTCGDPSTVPFVGDISTGKDRVGYYRDLMKVLKRRQGW